MCCPCGFAPDSIDMFVTQLKLRRRRGLVQAFLGGALLALMIPAWLLVGSITGGVVITVLTGSVVTISGITITGRGLLQAGRATRHLQTVSELRQLPTARARLLGP